MPKIGRVFSVWERQNIRGLTKNERVEAVRAAPGGKEALAIALGVGFGFRSGLAEAVHCGVGEAEQNPPDGPERAGGVGITDAAQVLLHRQVQRVVEAAFDHPVAAFEPEHALGLQLIQSEAAHQENHLVAPFAFAQHAGVEARHQARAGEAGLAGSDFDQLKRADFRAPAVLLLDGDFGARAVLRGKNPVR